MATPIINESTSVVQVDSSGLQNGDVSLVYVSSTSIPGQLVTVIDATGFTSSPQAILLSTVGGGSFSDGASSTSIRQRFGYITLHSDTNGAWSIVNSASFSNPTVANAYRSLDSDTVNSYLAEASGLVSTAATAATSLTATSGSIATGLVYTSTLYINSISSFLASRPSEPPLTLVGNTYISGALIVTGSASYRGSLYANGDLFTAGNISSKLGIIYVGGDLTTAGTIRGQRGTQVAARTMSISGSSGFAGQVRVQSTVSAAASVYAQRITSPVASGISMNVMSSIIFGDEASQSMRNTSNGLDIVGVSMTIPSWVSTSWLTASNSLTTSNLALQSFGPASTLQYLTLGSTLLVNARGSLITSSLQIGTGHIVQGIYTAAVEDATTFETKGIQVNDATPGNDRSISFGGATYDISGYWMLSSIGAQGTLNAPYTTLSTVRVFTHGGSANLLATDNDTLGQFNVGAVRATAGVYMNGLSTTSFKNVLVNNFMGSIMGSRIETVQGIHCSSLITEQISTGVAMRFLSPIAAQLKRTFISTVTSGAVTTSSLTATQITSGHPHYYSTVNPNAPWLLTSSFTVNTPPLTVTKGLGTYFDEASIVASMNQTTYYSIINPAAQTKQFLSTPYVNSIAGTGTPGVLVSGEAAARAPLGSELSPAVTDASGIVYVGSKDLGWKIQKITPAGSISTVAGNYRYFYGDGQTPFAAAFGPQLAVSVSPQSRVLITDISNVRIRTFTADPYVQTIAGTGVASYSGDGGRAYLATFSTPTATATDMSGYIYVADRLNHIIRQISGSTISTFAGIPGVAGAAGDGGPATAATLGNPFGLATDLSNNLYFTDLSSCVIRRVTPAGGISLVAGTYAPGFGGDGGPAAAAYLSTPRSIAVDLNRNIYFCDTGNSRVRRIDAATQQIQTIAGNGTSAYGGDGGLAINASLSTPTGVATDVNGNVYISDTNNQCIRYVDMATNIIRTVAGRPQRPGSTGDYSFATFALLNFPSHIALDTNTGYLYIADDGNSRIRYVNPAMNIIYPFAGNGSPLYTGDGGQASGAVFGAIRCLSMGAGNTLYVVDDTAHVIRAINLTTGIISGVAGTGVAGYSGEGTAATLAQLSSPQTLVTDSLANLYFTDRDNQRIRTISPAGIISTFAGTGVAGYNGDGISSIYATLSSPTALAIDSASRTLYLGDLNNNRIRALNANIIRTYAGNGEYGAPTEGRSFVSTTLAKTTSIAVDSNAQVYFTEAMTHGIWRLNQATSTLQPMSLLSTGAYLGDAGPLSNAYFKTPSGLNLDGSGNFLISDGGNSRLRRTYTYGYPQTPVYLTMNFTYTNYFASTGTTSIALNGNTLTTFYGSNLNTTSYHLSNADIYSYPLQGSNPVFGDQTPYIQLTQTDTYGYTKLDGILFAQEVPSQGELQNSVDSTTGLTMNSGALIFPHENHGITIDNRFNDASLRSILYTGQLLTASDPALKEEIEEANTSLCYSTMTQLPLKRYAYSAPYVSTFRVKDTHRLGYLTTDVAPLFPRSVEPLGCDEHTWMSSTCGLDTTQLRFAHYGVTQHLMGIVSTLESEVDIVARSIVAQRNTIL